MSHKCEYDYTYFCNYFIFRLLDWDCISFYEWKVATSALSCAIYYDSDVSLCGLNIFLDDMRSNCTGSLDFLVYSRCLIMPNSWL